jgi:hypothetical protein
MSEDKVFAEGFSFKRNANAPEFVVGRLSVKVDEAISFIKKNEKSNWVNLSIKQARSGNYYLELDTFEPKKTADSPKTDASKEDAPKSKVSTKSSAKAQPTAEEELPF